MNHLQVKQQILDTVDPVASMNGKTLTNGRLNLYKMLATSAGPNLDIADEVAVYPNQVVNVPISYTSPISNVSSMVFSVDYDQSCLSFDSTDGDGDGMPDAVLFNLPSSFTGSAIFDVNDTDGEIDIAILDPIAPLASLSDGVWAMLQFTATCTPSSGSTIIAPVTFSADPAASFGDTTGASLSGSTSDGSVEIHDNGGGSYTPGDCNGDGNVDAGDISCLVLEIFDGDGDAPADTPGGSHPGTPGSDANQDVTVNAADISCTVLIIYNGQGACSSARNGRSAQSELMERPVLRVGAEGQTAANGTVTFPVTFVPNGHEISALIFSFDFDQEKMSFDPTDADSDGLPDAISFNIPASFFNEFTYEVNDEDGELDFFVADLAIPLAALPEGEIATLTMQLNDTDSTSELQMNFSQAPLASFGSTDGESVDGVTEDGVATITGTSSASNLYLPLVQR